jgi:hypothetical protein
LSQLRSPYDWNRRFHEKLISRDTMQLEEVLGFVKQLSLVDKVRLIERVAPEIERDLKTTQKIPKRSLWGICSNLGTSPSADQIDQTRHEVWANFPREDS